MGAVGGVAVGVSPLPYVLCAAVGAAVMFNLILLVWRCVKFRPPRHSSRHLQMALCFLDAAYVICGVGVALLVLYKDVSMVTLCDAGGFLVLFSTQACLSLLALCAVFTLIWLRLLLSPYTLKSGLTSCDEPKRCTIRIFILCIVLISVILAVLSFLPFTKLAFFDAESEFFYLCTPLRLPGERGWSYSSFIFILNWLILLAAMVTTAISISKYLQNITRIQSLPRSRPWLSKARGTSSASDLTFQQAVQRVLIALSVDVSCWLLTYVIVNISYFTSGAALARTATWWTLGFAISVTLLVHPIATFVVTMATRQRLPCSRVCGRVDAGVTMDCPRSLHTLTKISGSQSDKSQYLVEWINGRGTTVAGVMKVYQPCNHSNWRNEVTAVSKLSPGSGNLVQYLWDCPSNLYTPSITAFTGDRCSGESSVICRRHYPHGCLQTYLVSHIHTLTEVSLHKITLDIAAGLEFLHQRNLVHNGLTTQSVYMAAVSEKTGVRAVVGDFEKSYEVSADTLRKSPLTLGSLVPGQSRSFHSLYSISQQVDMDNNKFAPDIRAFGLVVLEMLVAMGEHNQKRLLHQQASQRQQQHRRRADERATVRNVFVERTPREVTGRYDADTSTKSHSHVHGHGQCTCSKRVTDIRACREVPSRLQIQSEALCDPEQMPFSSSSCETRSAFASVRVRKDRLAEPGAAGECGMESVEDGDLTLDRRLSNDRLKEIQQRRLPAIPATASSKDIVTSTNSLREYASCTQSDNSMDSDEALTQKINLSVHEPAANDNDHTSMNLSLDLDKADSRDSLPQELSSPSSDDFYNASLGSIGSFDTIYEEEEVAQRADPETSHRPLLDISQGHSKVSRKAARPPVVRRKLEEPLGTSRKRFSMASLDESILSGDSGLGSYSDTASEKSSSLYLSNIPGSRDAVYTSESDSAVMETDSYSLIRNFISPSVHRKRIKKHPTDSAGSDISKSKRPVESALVTEKSFDSECASTSSGECQTELPDLRMRKQPCSKLHPDPNHPCNIARQISFQNPSTNCDEMKQDSVKSPIYEQLPGRHAQGGVHSTDHQFHTNVQPRDGTVPAPKPFSSMGVKTSYHVRSTDSLASTCGEDDTRSQSSMCSACRYCGRMSARSNLSTPHSDLLGVHPFIRNQYGRHPGSNLPKLGVSAVTRGRRMSDTSCSSISTQKSLETLPTAPHKPGERYAHHAYASAPTMLGYKAQTDELPHEAAADRDAMSAGSFASLSSSVLSMLQDSKLLLDAAEMTVPSGADSDHLTAANHRSWNMSPEASITRQQPPKAHHHRTHHKLGQGSGYLGQVNPVFEFGAIPTANQGKLMTALDVVKRNGKLGFIAQQMMPLLSDCWGEDHVPTAEQILQRLDLVLPTASV